MIMERVKTDDNIPYWDYNAPALKDTPRDASAAAVTASAFWNSAPLLPMGRNITNMPKTCSRTYPAKSILPRKVQIKDLSLCIP